MTPCTFKERFCQQEIVLYQPTVGEIIEALRKLPSDMFVEHFSTDHGDDDTIICFWVSNGVLKI